MKYCFLRYPGGKFKAVTLSYDDGSFTDKRFIETINKYGMKATFNIHASVFKFDSERTLSKADVEKYVFGFGHELAAHGAKHAALGLCTSIEYVKEALYGRVELERTFGRIIRGMAYPDSMKGICGDKYLGIKETLRSSGIVYSRSCAADNDKFDLPADFHMWVPTAHHDNPKLFELADSFLALDEAKLYRASRWPRLFYIWGHSSEFESKNNWHRLDEICEKLSGREDVWYATNIEIYDYVKAYESLIFSANAKKVYNPTLITVWLSIDGVGYVVKPGETVNIAD